jgi:hypothetical protein
VVQIAAVAATLVVDPPAVEQPKQLMTSQSSTVRGLTTLGSENADSPAGDRCGAFMAAWLLGAASSSGTRIGNPDARIGAVLAASDSYASADRLQRLDRSVSYRSDRVSVIAHAGAAQARRGTIVARRATIPSASLIAEICGDACSAAADPLSRAVTPADVLVDAGW